MTHQLLDGHALQGRVIEICGLPGSGKTALTYDIENFPFIYISLHN